MPKDHTPAELKSWITKLHDPETPTEELKRIAMTLAHIDDPEALQALERFRESPRAHEVEWIECAVDEATFFLLSPDNEGEEKDYIGVHFHRDCEPWLKKRKGIDES